MSNWEKPVERRSMTEMMESWWKGRKVLFAGASDDQVKYGGYDDPRKVLKQGQIYEVAYAECAPWTTALVLVGVEGRFNSVCFYLDGIDDADV